VHFWNQSVHHSVHKSPPLNLTLSQFNPFLTSAHYLRDQTERRSRVVNTPASYSEGPGLMVKVGPEIDHAEVFLWLTTGTPGECHGSTLQLGHDASFQLLSHSSFAFSVDAI